jgi:hypothetical protein
LKLLGLHNHMNQFLTFNLSISLHVHMSEIHTYYCLSPTTISSVSVITMDLASCKCSCHESPCLNSIVPMKSPVFYT